MKTFEEFLFELNIRHKTEIGHGKEHRIFDYEKDPTKVMKVAWGTENGENPYDPNTKKVVVDLDPEHIDAFIKFPDIFAKVFKRTKRYTIIEKLETKKPKQDEKELFNLISKYNFSDFRFMTENSAINDFYWQITNRSGLLNRMIKKMVANEDLTLFNLYVDLFRKINSGLKKHIKYKGIDVGSYNLGYDKEGNLKLLDF